MTETFTCECCEKVFNTSSNQLRHQRKCIENKKIEDSEQLLIQQIADNKKVYAEAKIQADIKKAQDKEAKRQAKEEEIRQEKKERIQNKQQEKEARDEEKRQEKRQEKAEKKAKEEAKEEEIRIEKQAKKAKEEAKEQAILLEKQEKQAKILEKEQEKEAKNVIKEQAKLIKIIDYLDFNWDTVKELFKKKSLADYFKDGKDTFFSRILKTIFSNPQYRCIRLNKERTNIDNYFEIHTTVNQPQLPNKADFDTFELYKLAKQKYYIEMSNFDEEENMGWTDTLYNEPIGGQSFFDVLHQIYCEGEPTDGAIKRFEYTFIISGKNNNTFKSFIGDIITGVDIKAT